MDGSNPSSHANSEPPETPVDDIDRSAPLSSTQILRRSLQDDSGNEYYIYVPSTGATDAPVLVAVHDNDRSARAQAEAFEALCERDSVVIVAPHFSAERYPNFQRLGRSHDPADERRSADTVLNRILEEVTAISGASTDNFHLFGFGGGGRFAMRYAMLYPERVAHAVICEPGAYTFPDPSYRFPRGIAPSRKRPDFEPEPSRFLGVRMTLIESENHPNETPALRLEQGGDSTRRTREMNGLSWSEAMVEAALAHGLPPKVAFRTTAERSETFDAFASDVDFIEGIFDSLFASSAMPPESGSEDAKTTNLDPRIAAVLAFLQSPEVRKWATPALGTFAVLAVLTPLFIWAQYRSTHIISRDAVLRGHIAEVGAQLNGVVKHIEVDSGDRVTQGQVIVRLEDRHFEAKRVQAESQLEKAQRELEVERLAIENERSRQKSSLRGVSADLSAARAEVRAAESRAEEAKRRFELQPSLADQGLVAEERVRAAETEHRTALALVSAARAERAAAAAGHDLAETVYEGLEVREKRVSILESDISALAAELSLAEANLASSVIRAPEDGAVVRRIVEPGSSTVVGQPIMSLWLGKEIWVEAWIDEDEIGSVHVGSRASVTFKSHPDVEFGGAVESLAVATDIELPDSEVPQPRNERMRDAPVVSARVKLDPHEETLFPGLSAVVAIEKRDR